MNENQLYNGIIEGAKTDNWSLIKIVDGSVGKKPFDMFGLDHNDCAVALEVKVYRGAMLFGKPGTKQLPLYLTKLFESQQLPWLRYYASRNQTSLALFYHLNLGRMFVYDFKRQEFVNELQGRLHSNWTGWIDLWAKNN